MIKKVSLIEHEKFIKKKYFLLKKNGHILI